MDYWNAAVNSRFVTELVTGEIDDKFLGEYLVQDYQFFEAFMEVIGAAITYADTLEAKVRYGQQLGFICNDENDYFVDTFKEIGVDDYAAPELKPATVGFFDVYARVIESRDYKEIVTMLYVAEALYLDWARRYDGRPLAPKHFGWVDVHLEHGFIEWVDFLHDEFTRLGLSSDDELYKIVTKLEFDFFEEVYK
ncbi:MAG: TenA family protein [Lactobacillales bacterium]|jgi:thiaminase|nr:TenA family protein [Lactobacillales bacterium]